MVLCPKITDLKNNVKLFIKLNPIYPCLGLSNEVLGIHAAQEAAKPLERSKFEVQKIVFCDSAWVYLLNENLDFLDLKIWESLKMLNVKVYKQEHDSTLKVWSIGSKYPLLCSAYFPDFSCTAEEHVLKPLISNFM